MKNLILEEKTYVIPENIAKNLFISTGSKYVLEREEIFLESSRIKLEDLIEVCLFEEEDLGKIYCGEDLDLYKIVNVNKTETMVTALIKRKKDNKLFSGNFRVSKGIIVSTLFKEIKSA